MTSKEIRDSKFSRAMSGYKIDEVDNLLDAVQADYENFEKTINDLNAKINSLNKEMEEYKKAQNSIQSVLLNAQVLSDKIVDDAKKQAEEIIGGARVELDELEAKKRDVYAEIESDAAERKATIEKDIIDTLALAGKKAESIDKATEDSVNRQQMLFDKLKLEIAEFKADVLKSYKEQIAKIEALPGEVPMDPDYVAKIITADLEAQPDTSEFMPESEAEDDNGFVVEETKEEEV
ncbi:MAG: DivIVA domain-containing protein [Clostridia bacterium]|nr:DivIVA domain-containing protein [Clostridia bacterium]